MAKMQTKPAAPAVPAAAKPATGSGAAKPAVAAAAPVVPVAAAPAVPEEKAKRPKLPAYPGLWDAAADGGKGAPLKLELVPDDYDRTKHAPLKKKDFSDEAAFHDYSAALCMEKAQRHTESAAQLRLIGNVADKKSMTKFVKMLSRLEELKAKLVESTPEAERAALIDQLNAKTSVFAQTEEAPAEEAAAEASQE